MSVIILRKPLTREPPRVVCDDFEVSPLSLPDDAASWLALRQRAFADQFPRVGAWTHHDLAREIGAESERLRRPTWLARKVSGGQVCGAISVSPATARQRAVGVHWLMVDPECQRRGVATLLLSRAEYFCWENGCSELRAETHRNWAAAVQFYQRHGFT